MKRFIVSLFSILLVFILPFVVLSADPWNEGSTLTIAKKLSGWYPPKVIQADSGGTFFNIDVSQGGVLRLDMTDITAGASLYFIGKADIPTRTLVVFNGTGDHIQVNTGGSSSPIVYKDAGAWPFDPTSVASYVYVIEVMSGLGDTGGTTQTGLTIYAKSGETYYQ